MFEKLLAYQKLDSKLLALKKEEAKNPAKANLSQALSLAKNSQSQLIALDATATAAIREFEKSKTDFEKDFTLLNNLSKENFTTLPADILTGKLEEINLLSSKLAALERALSLQAENINSILKTAEQCKKCIILSRQKYNENKKMYEECCRKFAPQIDDVKTQMHQMEKEIEPKFLAKYKHLRQDNIFPAFVPLNGTSCGGCSMEVPAAPMNRLKEQGYLECEQCRRYIYIK